MLHDQGRLAAGAVQLDGDGRRAGVQHELGDLVVRFDLRRGETDGEEDRGAARDDALAGENREDSGGVLSDGKQHGGVAVVLEGHRLVGGVARVARGEGEAAVGEQRFRYEVLAARSEGVAARGKGEAPRQSERLLGHQSEGSHRLERTKRLEGLGVVLPVRVRAELHL